MTRKFIRRTFVIFTALFVSGCATYSISEKEIADYLQDNLDFEQSVGVQNVMYAQVAIDDIKVNIGRADADRVSIFANTTADVEVMSFQEIGLDLDIEFSAIPEYDSSTGEVFLKSMRLERFDEHSDLLTPNIKTLLEPAVSMIGQALSSQPVYKLDGDKVEQALLKSTNPNLVIKDNKLVIEVFN